MKELVGMGQSCPKSCLQNLSYLNCLVKSLLAAAALSKAGNAGSGTESSQAVVCSSSPFSSYQDKQHLCTNTISLSLSSSSTTPHLQMPANPLLLWLVASPATCQPSQTQLPALGSQACAEDPSRLPALQSARLSSQHFHSLTVLLASLREVAHEMETVTAR